MKFMARERITSQFFDILFCVVLMPLLIVLGPAHYWAAGMPLFFILVCVYFYGCYFLLKVANLPGLLLRRRYLRLAAVLAGLTGGVWLLSCYPLPKVDFFTPNMTAYQTRVRDYGVELSLWMMYALVGVYALTVSFARELYGRMLNEEQLKTQKKSAELAALRAQISPHFLFNTLNSLYSLVVGTSQKAEDALIRFAEIMEYSYRLAPCETVTLEQEIRYIDNYIDLQKLRLSPKTEVIWRHEADRPEVHLPPLLLSTFVENAFKHGASGSKPSIIRIELSQQGDTLAFHVENSKIRTAGSDTTESIGLENTRRRLRGIFPDLHRLQVTDSEDKYITDLTIRLNND